MRIYASPMLSFGNKRPLSSVGTGHAEIGTFSHLRSSFEQAHFFHIVVSLMPSHSIRFLPLLLLQNCCAVMAMLREIENGNGDPVARNASG
jgi:hypothetical protein